MTQPLNPHNVKPVKLYNKIAVGIATFLGGPAAGGYLIRQNYINLGDRNQGNTIFVVFITANLVLLSIFIFLLSDEAANRIGKIIVFLNTGIVYLFFEARFKKIIAKHELENGAFYSNLNAVGVGIVSLLLVMTTIFTLAFIVPDPEAERYDELINQYNENHEIGTTMYNVMETGTQQELLNYIDHYSLPAWTINLSIARELMILNYPGMQKQDRLLLQLAEKNVLYNNILKEAILENQDTEEYMPVLDSLDKEIDRLFDDL